MTGITKRRELTSRFWIFFAAWVMVATAVLPMFTSTQSVSAATYNLGDTGPAGGLIFHIDGDTYYEAASSSEGYYVAWGCDGIDIPGAEGTAIGTGQQNTVDILAGCAEAGIAARLADDYVSGGYDDWFLPSIDEVNAMYENLHLAGLGNFPDDRGLASSSELSATTIQVIWFADGSTFDANKNSIDQFRPARSFIIPSASDSTTISANLAPTISLTTSGSVDFDILPTSSGSMSSSSDTVSVSTNSSTGYTLQMEAGFGTAGELFGPTWNIMQTSGTDEVPTNLDTNTWGYRVDGVGGFGNGPTSAESSVSNSAYTWANIPDTGSGGDPAGLTTTSAPVTNDTTIVWFGANVDTSLESETYYGEVVYTAVTN